MIFHQPRFSWNKGISLTKPPFGVRSCEVAIIWPESSLSFQSYFPMQPRLEVWKTPKNWTNGYHKWWAPGNPVDSPASKSWRHFLGFYICENFTGCKRGDSTNMVHLLAVVTRNLFLKVLNFSRIRPAAVESLHGFFSVRPLTGCGTPHEKTWPVFEASGQLKNYLTNFSSLLEFLRKK